MSVKGISNISVQRSIIGEFLCNLSSMNIVLHRYMITKSCNRDFFLVWFQNKITSFLFWQTVIITLLVMGHFSVPVFCTTGFWQTRCREPTIKVQYISNGIFAVPTVLAIEFASRILSWQSRQTYFDVVVLSATIHICQVVAPKLRPFPPALAVDPEINHDIGTPARRIL